MFLKPEFVLLFFVTLDAESLFLEANLLLLLPFGFADELSSFFLPKVFLEPEFASFGFAVLFWFELLPLLLLFPIGSALIFGSTLNPTISTFLIFCLINFSIPNK